MNLKQTTRIVTCGLAVLFLLGVTSSASAVARPQMSDILAGGSNYFGIGEQRNADGTVTDRFANAVGASVTVSTSPGVTVTIRDTVRQNQQGVLVYMPQVSVSVRINKADGPRNAVTYSSTGRSVVKDAIAAGMVPIAAQRIFGHMMVLDSNAPRAAQMGTLSQSPIEWSGCERADSSDGHVHEYGCDTQYLDQANGADWYLVDQHQASGWSDQADCCWADRVSVVREWLSYTANNVLVRWNPGSTQLEPSSCNQVTISITGQSGIGYSQTQTICKVSFGPYNLRGNPAQFGSIWNGEEPAQNWYEGTASDDLVHSPPNAADYLTFTGSMDWNNPFCC